MVEVSSGKTTGVISRQAINAGNLAPAGASTAAAVAAGLDSEMDRFGVDFPDHATPQVKATLLAATFLLDFLFFEDGNKLSG